MPDALNRPALHPLFSSNMHHHFNVTLSKRETDRALLKVFMRHGKGLLIGSLFLVGCALFDFLHLGFGVAGYFSIAVLSLLWIWGLAIIIGSRRRTEARLRTLNGEAVSYDLTDTGIGASSPLGQATIPWESLKEIWIFRDLALIHFRDGGYFTIPRQQISSAAFDFIVGRMVAHGCKIVDVPAKN